MNGRIVALASLIPLIGGFTPVWGQVYFEDETLRSVVKEALGITHDPDPTEMLDLTRIYAFNRGIGSLVGLEYALNLDTLSLYGNQISDLSPLAGLTHLKWVWLHDNQIGDISALAASRGLIVLSLSDNQISSISALAGMTSLRELWLYNNQIGGISALADAAGLEYLFMWNNQVTDVSALAEMTHLIDLSAGGNQITDLSPLGGVTNLTVLRLNDNQIDDISALSGMTQLATLSLHDNPIADISPLAGMTDLTEVYLFNGQITDISPLSGLTALEGLWLHNNQIEDISSFLGKTNLVVLTLGDNQISDISALADLTNLTELWLYSNQIEDVSALVGMTRLEYLFLSGNQVADISALCALTGLGHLDLRWNPLNSDAYTIHIPQMESNGTEVLYDEPQWCVLTVDDPIWVGEADRMVLPYDKVELAFLFHHDGDSEVRNVDVTFAPNPDSDYGAAIEFEDPGPYRIDSIPAHGSAEVKRTILIAGLGDRDTSNQDIWEKVVKEDQTLSLEKAICVHIVGTEDPCEVSPRMTQDEGGDILAIQYPDFVACSPEVTHPPEDFAYYGCGGGDEAFHHPNHPYVRKLALKASMSWGSELSDSVQAVVWSMYAYVRDLYGDFWPHCVENDASIAVQVLIGGAPTEEVAMCITQAYLLTSLARTVGIPAREVNMELGPFAWRIKPVLGFKWQQHAAGHLWYDEAWHLYDPMFELADVTDLRVYLWAEPRGPYKQVFTWCVAGYATEKRSNALFHRVCGGGQLYGHMFDFDARELPNLPGPSSNGWTYWDHCIGPTFTIIMGSPARMFLLDETGRRTGFVDGGVVEEIRGSHYVEPGFRVYANSADPESFVEAKETIYVADSLRAMDYSLVVTGMSDGPYSIVLAHLNDIGEITHESFSFEIRADETHEYDISVSAGGEVSIAPAAAMKARLWMVPPVVHREKGRFTIGVVLRLPEGITKDQVDADRSLVLYPGGLTATNQSAIQWRKRRAVYTSIIAFFNKADLMAAVPSNGPVQINVFGQLTTGQFFSGSDTLRIFGGSWWGDDDVWWDVEAFD